MIAVGDWCAFRRLQLNPSNTELIWFSLRVILRKIAANDLSLRVDNDVVTPVDAVILDPELTMQRHVNTVASACVCHIRRLKQIRRLLGPEVTATLISAFVLSRLDYCNAVLAGLPSHYCATATFTKRSGETSSTSCSERSRDYCTPPLPMATCARHHFYLADTVTLTASVSCSGRLSGFGRPALPATSSHG